MGKKEHANVKITPKFVPLATEAINNPPILSNNIKAGNDKCRNFRLVVYDNCRSSRLDTSRDSVEETIKRLGTKEETNL